MPKTFVTDLRHFVAEDGSIAHVPTPALELARHLASIVAWVTAAGDGETNVACRSKQSRRRCSGDIVAQLNRTSSAVEWACPTCGENGHISGWEGTIWDRREARGMSLRGRRK